MKIVFSPRCLEYSTPGHPESPERVRSAYEHLAESYTIIEPKPVDDQTVLEVHTERMVDTVKSGNFYDPDSPAYPGIYEYAKLSVGAACLAAKEKGFALTRPPGHHAGKNFFHGFCYLNNIAIAVQKLGKTTLIIDIDGHHGDGTQDIFRGNPKVVYVSLHREHIFPGTGYSSVDNCLNYPLPAGVGDKGYLETLEKALIQAEKLGKNYELVAISAGFDTYGYSDLASLGLTTQCYKKIGEMIAGLGLPVFVSLEGGYKVKELGPNIDHLLQGLEG